MYHSTDHPLRLLWRTTVWTAMLPVAVCLAAPRSAGDAALFERLDVDEDGSISADEVGQQRRRLFVRLLRRADANQDRALSREEFLASLVPSRPEKPIEAKQPATFPQADAVRWLLLTLDTSGNSQIEPDEVPAEMKGVFEALLERLDKSENGVLERIELNRGGPPLAQIAGRYARQNEVDVPAALRKFEKRLGPAAKRFERQRVRLESLGDPQQAREVFVQLDGNGDGHIEAKEVAAPLQRPFRRLLDAADRDRDGGLSRREFLAGAKRMARRQARRQAMQRQSQPKPAESASQQAR